MANPTSGVWQFSDDLDGQTPPGGAVSFVGVDPIRYDAGLWLEQATKNVALNTVAASDLTSYGVFGNRANTRITTLPAPLPGTLASVITTGVQITASASQGAGQSICTVTANAESAGQHALSWWVYIPTAFSATGVRLDSVSFTSSSAEVRAYANMTLRDQWQRIENSLITLDGGDLSGAVRLIVESGTWLSGESVYVTAVQMEQFGHSTSAAALGIGAGYSDDGSGRAVRAASSAAISPSGILAPGSGSLAFRFTRKIDTGDIEYILNCGTDGDDRLRIYIDTDDRLRVAWDTGGALPQSVVSSSTIAVGTEYLVYTEWDGINIAMSLDAGTLVTGIRDVPLGSWGTDDLVLGP